MTPHFSGLIQALQFKVAGLTSFMGQKKVFFDRLKTTQIAGNFHFFYFQFSFVIDFSLFNYSI